MSDAPCALPVQSAREIAARQVLLTVPVRGTPLEGTHRRPGQYARLGLEGGVPRPFVIASPPGASVFEFLLKVPAERTAERTAELTLLGQSDRVEIGHPQGAGFPLEKAEGHPLWLIAVGSGVAALRSVIEHLLPRRTAFGEITLLYGVRHANELAFTERFGPWAGHGIKVIPVVSRAEPTWGGATGYVQHHLPKKIDRAGSAAVFICGLPEMEKAVAAALLERGVGPDQIHRNW
jgi:NAD(P)H-flavin reductase